MKCDEAKELLGITDEEWRSFKQQQTNDWRLLAFGILCEELVKCKGTDLPVLSPILQTLNRLDKISTGASHQFYEDFFTVWEDQE